jgi:hypothetical protein
VKEREEYWLGDQPPEAPGPRRPPLTARTLLLGVLTVWPPIYIVLFMLSVVAGPLLFASAPRGGGPPVGFVVLMVLHIGTMFEMLALTVFYAVHVYREPALQGDRKILWMVIVLLGGFVGQGIYYVLWIVKRHPGVLGLSSRPVSASASLEPADPEH